MIKFLFLSNSFDNFSFHFEIEICVDYCERKARQCGKIFGELRPNVIVRILSQGDYIGMYMYIVRMVCVLVFAQGKTITSTYYWADWHVGEFRYERSHFI